MRFTIKQLYPIFKKETAMKLKEIGFPIEDASTNKGNSNCNYCVKNGICYVSLWGVKIASTGGTIKPGVILPKCANNRAGALMTGTGDAIAHAFAFIIDNGELCFDVKDANISLYGSFSYPVAEE